MSVALRVEAEGHNVTQAVSPVALGEELNAGWHLNVPSLFVLELLLVLLNA
jgi:hypothetical protein